MNWEWPYIIALVGALIPGILGVLGWVNERRKGSIDLMTLSHTSTIQMLQAAQERLKDVETELQTLDERYDAEKMRRREYEDTLAEERRQAKAYLEKIKELEALITNLEKQVIDLRAKLTALEEKGTKDLGKGVSDK